MKKHIAKFFIVIFICGIYKSLGQSSGCAGKLGIPVLFEDFIVVSPTTTVTTTSTPACGSNNGSASVTATGGTGTLSYLWNPSAQTTLTATGLSAGMYTVTVTDATGSTAFATQSVVASPAPVANFSTMPVCFNQATTVFKDLSVGNTTITKWDWNFGDGNSSPQQNPSHTYGSAGIFTATLIVTNSSGCKDTVSLPVIVNPLPATNFSSIPVCYGNPSCFTDLSTIASGSVTGWNWNFGDPNSGLANTATIKNPCHTFTGLGPFSVILTSTSDSGCQSTTMLLTSLNAPPIAGINPQNVCLNSSTHFIDGSTSSTGDPINAWNWDFGDGNTSNQQNPFHTYSTSGTYTITLNVASQKGCKDTTTNVVTVYDPPVANFSGSGAGCGSACVTNFTDLSLHPSGTIATWQWSFPGGTPSSSTAQTPPKICYDKTGSYGASLIVTTNYGCKDTVTLTSIVNVYSLPKAKFCVDPESTPITDPVFSFCDLWSADVVKWSWNFGDSSAVDTINKNPMHSYSATATNNDFYNYKVCIRVENQHGRRDTICHSVELTPEFEFYIPNSFSPNEDYINDMFYAKCRGVKEYNIWIFDRWGNQLWDCHNEGKNTDWDNDKSNPRQEGMSAYCRWDGKVVPGGLDMNGKSREVVPEDIYVWKVRLTDIFDKPHFYIGHVSVIK